MDNSKLKTTREPKEPTRFENFSSRNSLYEVFIVKIRKIPITSSRGQRKVTILEICKSILSLIRPAPIK